MTIKPQEWYIGKELGEFVVEKIRKVNGQPVFVIETIHGRQFSLTLDEMKAENPKECK